MSMGSSISTVRPTTRVVTLSWSRMRTLKTTLKLCKQAFQTDWDVALQAAALAYRATPHTVTGHTPFFLLTGQEVVLPLSGERHEPALCALGVTWLEALWRCRVQVIKAHGTSSRRECQGPDLRYLSIAPGEPRCTSSHQSERQAEGKFSPFFKGLYVIVNVKPAGVTADIRCLATGHMAPVNRCRLKFLEAIPQHALHLQHLPQAIFCQILRYSPPEGGGRCRRAHSAGLA